MKKISLNVYLFSKKKKRDDYAYWRTKAEILEDLGDIYRVDLNQNLIFYKTALDIFIKLEMLQDQADVFLKIAQISRNKQNIEEAEINYQKLLELNKRIQLVRRNSYISSTIYFYLQFGKCNQAEKVGDDFQLTMPFNLLDISNCYRNNTQYSEAKKAIKKAVELADANNKLIFLQHQFSLYKDLGEFKEAKKLGEKILQDYKKTKADFSDIVYYLGVIEQKNNPAEAVNFYQQALLLAKKFGNKKLEAQTFGNLMNTFQSLKNPYFAIFWGKKSVEKYQELRKEIKDFTKQQQTDFLKSIETTYRQLADILIEQGRFFEAEKVLDLLKEYEYNRFIRGAETDNEINNFITLPTSPKDLEIIKEFDKIAKDIVAIGVEVEKLESEKNTLGDKFTGQKQLDDKIKSLELANQAFRIWLENTQSKFIKETKNKETGEVIKEDKNHKDYIDSDSSFQSKLKKWGEDTVLIYTLLNDDRYRVILTTPNTRTAYESEIKAEDLNKKIFKFREQLRNKSVDPKEFAIKLFDILFPREFKKALKKANAKTLLWSLDGTLRYIPLSALHDGTDYLVKNYQNVVISPLSRQKISEPTDNKWKVLGFGVSDPATVELEVEAQEQDKKIVSKKIPISFRKLPNVLTELKNLKDIWGADTYSDEQFSLEQMKTSLGASQKYNVLHFSTHFYLGGDDKSSFMLLGNNQMLTVRQFSTIYQFDFDDYELVTLSACETAFDGIENLELRAKKQSQNNGVEFDSLSKIITRRSAKSALATLWKVDDEGTAVLISRFYQIKKDKPELTKSEALQLAQRDLLDGKIKSSGNGCAGRNSDPLCLTDDCPQKFTCDPKAPFSHPYYWSPFILIGNWR